MLHHSHSTRSDAERRASAPGEHAASFRRSRGGTDRPDRVRAERGRVLEATAALQGTYWLLSGLWGAVHRPSFEAVTGRKRDYWLVRTVGLLVAVNGAALCSAACRRRISPEIAFSAMGGGAALAAVEIDGVRRRRIRPVYLIDAAVHALLLPAWWFGWRRSRGLPR